MFRTLVDKRVLLLGFSPFLDHLDTVTKETKTARSADISAAQNETGKERLVRMFALDEFDNISPEVNTVLQVGCMSMFVGAIYGGVINSRTAYMDFMRNNQATVFKDHLQAKKKLQDKVTLSFGKGAFRWGWRLSLFSTSYIGLSTAISVYRGKNGIIEHVLAGTITGFLYKLPVGPRAWVVGSGLGLVLGGIAGTVTYGLLSLTGMSMEEVRYWQYKWRETRSDQFKEAISSRMEKDKLLLLHDEAINATDNSLDNLEQTETQPKS